jgi:hypothetical protein
VAALAHIAKTARVIANSKLRHRLVWVFSRIEKKRVINGPDQKNLDSRYRLAAVQAMVKHRRLMR